MAQIKASEYQDRLQRLRQVLIAKGIDVTIISQDADLFYYTGSIQPLYLVVPAAGEEFVLARKAFHRIQEEAPQFALETFSSTKGLAEIFTRRGITTAGTIGLPFDTMSYAAVQRLRQVLPNSELCDLAWETRSMRMVKSAAELDAMQMAGKMMAGLPDVVQNTFKPGMTELDLSAEIEAYLRRNGHCFIRSHQEGVNVGNGVCLVGHNSLADTKFDITNPGIGVSPALPHGASHTPIEKGQAVVLDYVFNFEGYQVDQTRLFCWGTPVESVDKAYRAMCRIQDSIFEALVPGAIWDQVYDGAMRLAKELGYGNEFMGIGTEKLKFVGHGIGLELDEPPFLAANLQFPIVPGMTIAVEPKAYLPDFGVVGIEDTIVVQENGYERLTTCSQEWILVEV